MKAADHAPSELILFVVTPSKDSPVRKQGQDMLRSCDKFSDVLHVRYQGGRSLGFRIGREASFTVVVLSRLL